MLSTRSNVVNMQFLAFKLKHSYSYLISNSFQTSMIFYFRIGETSGSGPSSGPQERGTPEMARGTGARGTETPPLAKRKKAGKRNTPKGFDLCQQ